MPRTRFASHRMSLGYTSIILLMLGLGFFILIKMQELTELTTQLYKHPFVVSRATLHIQIHIAKIHRAMKDLVLSRDTVELVMAVDEMNREEMEAKKDFEVVHERFLGDQEMVLRAEEAFAHWQPIRDEVIMLVRGGQRDKAAQVARGRGEVHMAELAAATGALTEFARNKADSVHAHALQGQQQAMAATIAFVALVILLGAWVARRVFTSLLSLEQARFQAMEAHQVQSIFLDNILKTATDLAIIAADPDFIIRYYNPVAERLFGYTAQDVIGRSVMEIHQREGVPPERFDTVIEKIRNNTSHSYEILQQRESGERIIESRVSCILDDRGTLNGYLLLSQDVTNRRLQEKVVQESRESLAKAQSIAQLGNWEWRIEQGVVTWSDEVYRIFGRAPDRFTPTYEGFLESVHPLDREQVTRAVAGALASPGQEYAVEHRVLRPDGSLAFVRELGQVERDGEGRPVRMLGTVQDVTQQHAIQEELRQEKEKFQAIFEQAAVGIAHLSVDGRFLQLNQRFANIVGHPWLEMIGMNFQEVTHPDDLEAGLRYVRQLLNGEISSFSMEKRCLRRDGDQVWINLSVSLVRNEEGKPKFFVSVIEDISRRKEMELRILDMNSMLEQKVEERTRELARSNRDLQQFAYVASHDLQEPLRQLSGFVQILDRRYHDQLDEKANEYIGYVVDGAQRMKELIEALLQYSRLGTPGETVKRVPLGEVLARVLVNLGLAIRESGANITIDELPTIKGDPARLVQLFQNLLINAIKFRGESALTIDITAEKREGEWIIAVRDNGIGIDPRHQERIFTIFQRLHSRAKYDGTGIGLALCQRIVEHHGGRIWVESEEGAGSTFLVAFPA